VKNNQPRVVSVVMCQEVFVRNPQRPLNYSLSTVFSTLNFEEFPATYPRMDVFIEMESLFGPAQIQVTVHSGSHFYRCLVEHDQGYPDGRPTYVASFLDIRFPRPGDYYVSVFDSVGNPLAERRLYVVASK
jgi:hypothetical protein